jgi:hypothetical protein
MTYSELLKIDSFIDRFKALQRLQRVGEETFGDRRFLNQQLYKSSYWLDEVRPKIILRDEANDLAMPGYKINRRILIHHINPITLNMLVNRDPLIFDPENLICVSHATHQAIHYGDVNLLPSAYTERRPNDQIAWSRSW